MRQKTENTPLIQKSLSVVEVAVKEGISTRTVYRHLKDLNGLLFGKYKPYRLGEGEKATWRLELISESA